MNRQTVVAGLYCHQMDEGFLDTFVPMWSSLHDDIPLILLNDVDSPVSDNRGLDTRDGHWAKRGAIAPGVVEDLAGLSADFSADWVIKLDCDCLHFDKRWMSGMGDMETDFRSVGCPYPPPPHIKNGYMTGAAYALRADTIEDIRGNMDSIRDIQDEDTAVTKIIRETFGEEAMRLNVNCMYGVTNQPNYDETRYSRASVLHCGQNIQGDRQAGIENMKRLAKNLMNLPL